MEARVETLLSRNPGFILNLSCNGAMVYSQELPQVGASVVLRCGPLDVLGTVMWAEQGRFGIQFDEPIPEEVVVGMRREADAAARQAMQSGEGRPGFALHPISVAEWKTAQEWAVTSSRR